ncbi:TRAP transporter substrate-binding protein DctP [Halomonas sp. LR3S48]|uniref:TRAP transporter substrate-binding protein DctP n=1 Tax=Halomonadaceae TaxID=28256 RepID=UPI0021E3EAA2|nr:TRAP transporter substrate-binding protein DctP [Halomonas sp. LR3S48]UYG04428.1 TRAP transporter substrate-binding protein DctP [Halomonas sp. LR3S48]
MLKRTLIAAAACSVVASLQANAQEVTWRVPTSVPEGSFFYENFLVRFADNVDKLTDGRVEIQPFGAGVIVPALEVYEAVQDGVVEAGHSTPTYLTNQDATNAIFASFPGGMSAEATLTWLYEGGGAERLYEFRAEDMGLKSMIVGVGTTEVLAHSNVELRTVEDFENLKYRTAGAWAAVLENDLNGVPTVVPPGEIYTLLQRRGVDAVEWATPGSNMTEGFHEVAPYLVLPGVHQPTFVWEVVLQQETWNELPEELQEKIEMAAKLTTYEGFTYFLDADMQAMEDYANTNVEIIELEPDTIQTLREAGRNWARAQAESQAANGKPLMGEVLEDYLNYQQRWTEGSKYLVRDGK